MFKSEDILARLQNGQDAGAIAQEFTNALNKAIAEQSAAQEHQEKVVGAQAILNDALNFVDEFYPDFKVPKEVRDSFSGASLVEIMDEAAAEVKQLENLCKTPKVKRTDEDALMAFLKQHHLA